MPAGFLVVLVTCPTKQHAVRLARTLVTQRRAACVNILSNVRSVFWWQGKVEEATEALLVIKTTARRFEPLRRAIKAGHPYQVPEIIALAITNAHQPYLKWLTESLSLPS